MPGQLFGEGGEFSGARQHLASRCQNGVIMSDGGGGGRNVGIGHVSPLQRDSDFGGDSAIEMVPRETGDASAKNMERAYST